MENQSTPLTPTFEGHISTTLDALMLFEACLTGALNHVPRRPHDRERQDLIRSGNVFIYEEHASGIKRWTDGVSWSPSRILGNFLIYRELEKPFPPGEKKRALKKTKKSPQGITKPEPPTHSNLGYVAAGLDPSGASKDQERSLIGSLVDSYPFKSDGLVKKTISISYQGVPHHLVSYYNVDDVISGRLDTPSKSAALHHVVPRSELFLSQNFRTPIDEVEYAVQDHSGVMASPYGPGGNGQFPSGGVGVIHRAMVHGNLQAAMNATHQSNSSSGYVLPHDTNTVQNGYTGTVPSSNFPNAMHQSMPYVSTAQNNYSLDPSRTDRFASTATMGHEFPRNMPSSTSSRRASIYDVATPQTDMSSMSFASHGNEARGMTGNPYAGQPQSYYLAQQRQSVPTPQTPTFPVARGLKADSDGLADDSVGHAYNLEDPSGVWGFGGLENHSDQQYFAGHAPSHAQWSNGPNTLHRA